MWDLLLVFTNQGKAIIFIISANSLITTQLPHLPLRSNLGLDFVGLGVPQLLCNLVLERDWYPWILQQEAVFTTNFALQNIHLDHALQTQHTDLGPTIHDGLANPVVVEQDHIHLELRPLSRGTVFEVEVPISLGGVVSALHLEGPLDLLLKR